MCEHGNDVYLSYELIFMLYLTETIFEVFYELGWKLCNCHHTHTHTHTHTHEQEVSCCSALFQVLLLFFQGDLQAIQ